MAGSGNVAQNVRYHQPYEANDTGSGYTETGEQGGNEKEELICPRWIESEVMRLFTSQ